MQDRITLFIIDEQPIYREGLKAVIKLDNRFAIIGEADNGHVALEIAGELAPDIVLTEISLPEIDGIELTKRLKAVVPETKVVILSAHADMYHISLANQAGVSGYILKNSSSDSLLKGLTAIASNQVFMDNNISGSIPGDALSIKVLEHYETQKSYKDLTCREQQIMRGLIQELSCQELAERFSISIKTVKNHRSNIMRKLGMKKEIDLIRFGNRVGLTKTKI